MGVKVTVFKWLRVFGQALYKDSEAKDKHSRTIKEIKANNMLFGKFDRHVDLIIGEAGKPEQWVELKSYSAKSKDKPHSRLTKNSKHKNEIVDVDHNFLWIFQKFDVSWKTKRGTESAKNVELGKASDTGKRHTVRGDIRKPIAGGKAGGKKYELANANFGENNIDTNHHIQESSVRKLLQGLVKAQFSEAEDALSLIPTP